MLKPLGEKKPYVKHAGQMFIGKIAGTVKMGIVTMTAVKILVVVLNLGPM